MGCLQWVNNDFTPLAVSNDRMLLIIIGEFWLKTFQIYTQFMFLIINGEFQKRPVDNQVPGTPDIPPYVAPTPDNHAG